METRSWTQSAPNARETWGSTAERNC